MINPQNPAGPQDAAKAQIRKKAKNRFRVTVILLVMISLAGGFVLYGLHFIPRIERQTQLRSNSLRLYYEYLRYEVDQGIGVAASPPPAVASAQQLWAEQLVSHFDHGAAVFVKSGSALTWPQTLPDSLSRRQVETVLAALDTATRVPQPLKSFGSAGLWLRDFDHQDADYRMWLVAESKNGLKWGAVYKADADWISFFKDLDTPKGTPLAYGGPAWELNGSFALPTSGNPQFLTGMRAYLNDSLLFASPALDMSRDSLQWTYPAGPRMEFFTGSRDFSYAKMRILLVAFLPLILLPLILIIPLTFWYRTVRRLTDEG
ncbi:MAG TPA: hypothetical protein VGL38_14500 [bacterium]